ncbi:MAG: peptidase [Peptococcaceae bacterium BICA1-7]|nr:MAG: peptidase [Peptococcaceae bacterium BICA1-7]HBV96908.1 site-2 protease family protein [Desulfotomaculum sp.]
MLDFFDPTRLLYMTPAVIIALSFHEFAHAAAAYRLGDRTAYNQGRLTANPIAHIDILGLIMLYIAGFGWAKPVPINPYNFRGDRDRGVILVSLAGPAANLIMAVLAAILLGAFFYKIPYLDRITQYIIYINVILAIFNLIPIPPLDGSKILAGLIPASREFMYRLEQYGFIILILLLVTNVIPKILGFFIGPVYQLLIWLAGTVNAIF